MRFSNDPKDRPTTGAEQLADSNRRVAHHEKLARAERRLYDKYLAMRLSGVPFEDPKLRAIARAECALWAQMKATLPWRYS